MVAKSFRVSGGHTVRLGRTIPAAPRLCPQFAAYLRGALPAPPAVWDCGIEALKWPMYANDRYGDCVFATCAHMLGLWSAVGKPPQRLFTDEAVLKMYSEVTGFDPRDPRTDNGAMITDALDLLCRPGRGIDVDTTAAYVGVPLDADMMRFRQACYLFGGIYLGVLLPVAWQSQTGAGKVWDIGSGPAYRPGSWGGHAVNVVAYDERGVTIVTWGRLQRMTWNAVMVYADERYALVDWDWAAGTKPPPHGFDLNQLLADWSEMGGSPVTPPVPPPPPPPPPPPAGASITVRLAEQRVALPAGWTAETEQAPAGTPPTGAAFLRGVFPDVTDDDDDEDNCD